MSGFSLDALARMSVNSADDRARWRAVDRPSPEWQAGGVGSQVLVVEDDASVREVVTLVLERSGFEVTAVGDGHAAIVETSRSGVHDLVLLDLMLPGMSGLDVCREIRRTSDLPIVMLTARADTADVVAGLELGADDYVTKPFEPVELAARVRAVLRRSADADTDTAEVLRVRDVRVDEGAFRAFRGDDELTLTATEFRLLAELVRHAGLVLTREVLLEGVWGYDYLGDSRLVDMAVMRLRDKLGDSADSPAYVSTVRGVGYRFEGD
jgi:two-component system, OmpR family, response regulator MtrA